MNRPISRALAIAGLCTVCIAPALAQTVKATTTITLSGPSEQNIAQYECDGESTPLTVNYINAEPNYLVLIPIEGISRIFVRVISGSGARYASSEFVWSISGIDAVLTSVFDGPDAPPVLTCTEIDDTP